MFVKLCKVASILMIFHACSYNKDYIGGGLEGEVAKKNKPTSRPKTKKEEEKLTKLVKQRKATLSQFSNTLKEDPQYGFLLPRRYQSFLLDPHNYTDQAKDYHFFSFRTPRSKEERDKLVEHLVREQNGLRSFIVGELLLWSTKEGKQKSLKTIKTPFCIATKGRVGYYIDLVPCRGRKYLPVYQMDTDKDDEIKLCYDDLEHFLEACKLTSKRKRAADSDEEVGPPTGNNKRSRN